MWDVDARTAYLPSGASQMSRDSYLLQPCQPHSSLTPCLMAPFR